MSFFKSLDRAGRPALAALLVLALAASAAFGETFEGKTVKWALSKGKVVEKGQTTQTSQGELTLGYVVEATAKSSNAPIKDGVFRATLSAFSPVKDMAGQKAGTWYVTGTWEIIDKNASKDTLKVKHSEAVMKGRLKSELSFNPAQTPGSLMADCELPMSHLGKNWGKGTGSFQGDRKFEGDFSLTIERWQKVK